MNNIALVGQCDQILGFGRGEWTPKTNKLIHKPLWSPPHLEKIKKIKIKKRRVFMVHWPLSATQPSYD